MTDKVELNVGPTGFGTVKINGVEMQAQGVTVRVRAGSVTEVSIVLPPVEVTTIADTDRVLFSHGYPYTTNLDDRCEHDMQPIFFHDKTAAGFHVCAKCGLQSAPESEHFSPAETGPTSSENFTDKESS